MSLRRPRRRSLLIVAIGLVLLGLSVAGAWVILDRPPTRSAEGLCEQLGQVDSLSQSIVTLDPTTLGPQVAQLQRASKVAPSEIQAQLSVLATFVAEIADTVRASPTDKKAALTAALADRQDRIDSVTVAGQAVEAWSMANCGSPLRTTTTAKTTPKR